MSQYRGVQGTFPFSHSLRAGALAAASLLVCTGMATSAFAQPADETVTQKTPSALIGDFIHYVNIDNPVLAQAMANELLARKVDPKEFVALVESGQNNTSFDRFDAAVAKAQRTTDLAAVATALRDTYASGKLAIARDPAQIAEAIKFLVGTERARGLGTERLKAAGEYAVPQLLVALLDNKNDPVLASRAEAVLVAMGPRSVQPLSAALRGLDGVGQERVATVLGAIGYPSSLPYLAELRDSTKNDSVKKAADQALTRFGPAGNLAAAELYVGLAERYVLQSADVTSFPSEDFQLLWTYNSGVGLTPVAIRTPVYHEAMAMQCVERALELKSENPEAVAIWVASNFRRENETPEGYANPAYPADRKNAMYFAVASGSLSCQRVLARAIDARNTPLARQAIAAISRTAGGSGLWATGLNRQPLLEALNYPSRRVQYEAALALAAAQPRESFNGSDRVVPTLAGAIREAGERNAVIFASSVEVYQAMRGIVEKAGYKVLPYGKSVGDISQPIAEASAVDLVITANLNTEQAATLVSAVRADAKLGASPVLVLATQENVPDLRKRYSTEGSIAVRPSSAGEAAIVASVKELVESNTGGSITADEASVYSLQALAALRDLAVSGNRVLRVEDAAQSLLASLGDSRENVRLDVAEVVSRIDQQSAQRALADACFKATGGERVNMLAKLSGSARRFGNKLDNRHVTRLRELAMSTDSAEATAAASVIGSLNLNNSQLLPLLAKQQ